MQFISISKANLYFLLIATILISSCTVVKNYPSKPFVYNNKIVINNNIDAKEKKRLIAELGNYWDDSLQIRKQSKIGFFHTKVIDKPAVFDSTNLVRTARFMENYLRTQGYYYANIHYDTSITIVRTQKRITPVVTIDLGKNITIKSVKDSLIDSNLQRLAMQNSEFSLLKAGEPYTKQKISNELDRLTALFNRNGYYNFRRDDIYALVDTTDSKFLDLTTDPFELIKLLDEYNKSKKENPRWDVTIRQRKDTTGISSKQYFIGHIYYYPQALNFDLIDTTINKFWLHSHTTGNYTIKFNNEIIKLSPLIQYTFFKRGDVYSNTNLFNTITAIGKLGAWKQVDAKFVVRDNDTLDLHIAMVPDKKYGIENTAELSKNTGDLTAGNLIGISANFTYRNRNVWKQAIQSFTSLRAGLELSPNESSSTLQTFFATVGQTYSFPKMIAGKPMKSVMKILPYNFMTKDEFKQSDKRTLLSVNAAYNDRLDLFRLRSVTGNYGYEFKKDNKTWLYSPINVELYSLDRLAGLDSLIKQNPFLQLSFNTGNVIGVGLNFSFYQTYINKRHSNRLHYFRYGIEESGLLAGMFTTLENKVYRYGKLEVEYKEKTSKLNSEFAYKLFGGLGVNYSNSSEIGTTLPFFKQFFVGGPNSMRAWGLRQLGQGSSILSDTSSSSFKDRFGDIRIEGNFEYRFNIFNASFVKIGSAIYADVGNVWNLKKNDGNPNSEFNLSRFYKDVAIGVGTGLRLDFSIFLIRVDVAYKLKDPARQYNDGWINLKDASLIEYRTNGTEVRNFAVQLGIGLPF
ncbi:MAG: BamA/TamA family outer membrane protein [Bacteroidetes bacterium]|nr:BamA/TamA family outer membrane protein [Bacteroidota bacterium]